ncbi:helix-turn-helix domain-containing protein [Nocardiopsis potens]|uniref:helix-turn-helix domain-containing protein n=1 Tax=Nocardiopsis potens TaxID=1246458 RepID=UPI00034D2574|nr:helix-turn-helix domain-containing protein [Nocardiopsis potens]
MSSENIPSENAHSENTASEPLRLRALAHPARLDLLYLLREEGEITATAAAERLGLSAKTCSYHLGLLGKYGLAEETGGGRGRARPWRLVPQGIGYTPSAGDEPAEAETQDAFARTVLDRDARIVRTFIDRRHRLPDAWRGRSAMSSNPLRLTAEQLAGLRDDLAGVLERYLRLSSDPAPGAVPVHAAVYAVLSDVDAVEEDG